MENQTILLLKLSDYLVAIAIGSLSAIAPHFVVSTSWSMLSAMFVGMAIAMFIVAIIVFPYSLIGGIFEVITPGMITGNIAGMVGGMWVVMSNPSLGNLVTFGFVTGFLVNGIFSLYDQSLHGEVTEIKVESSK
jgi:hypothetical protein